VYGKENASWVNYLATNKTQVLMGGCYFSQLKIKDADFKGTDDRNLFHAAYATMPTAKTKEVGGDQGTKAESKMIVYPNPASSNEAIQIDYPLEVGVQYLVSLRCTNGNIKEYALASFMLSQETGSQRAMYIPLGELEPNVYILTLQANGQVVSSIKLLVK